MTKYNKLGSTRETVYDRCSYVGCYNGKFINGRQLFHFPAETDRRLEMWIERSGNFRLRTWAATSLRKAGLCGDHFDDKCFTNATRKALRRNVVPRHYTEDLKLRAKTNGNTQNNVNNESCEESLEDEDDEDPLNCDRLTSSVGSTDALEIGINSDGNSSQSAINVIGKTTKNVADSNRSPSPVVEFIVEELDELLVQAKAEGYDSSASNVDDPMYEYEETLDERDPEFVEQSAVVENSKRNEDSASTIKLSEVNLQTYHEPKNNCQPEMFTDEDPPVTIENPTPRINNTVGCNNKRHKNMLATLREQNTYLRKTMRLLKQKLRRAEARESNSLKAREILKNIDEFLDVQECTNLVSRGIVKLALHKHNTAYTREEKDCATQLYRQSSTDFDRLRQAGCNFPSKSTIKRWITEEGNGEASTCDIMAVAEVDDKQDQTIENRHEISGERMVEELDEIQDHMEEAIDEANDAIDDLVGHLEEQIEDVQGYEEYIDELPPDDKSEVILQ